MVFHLDHPLCFSWGKSVLFLEDALVPSTNKATLQSILEGRILDAYYTLMVFALVM